jgi:hypothetical protein
MSRRALHLGPLVAVLLALQWAAAFGHCLAGLGGGGLTTEICTAEGLRTLHLDDQGQEQPPGTVQHDSCPLHPGAVALQPAAPALPAAPVAYARILPAMVAGLPPAPARAPPQQPRAPPLA